MGKNEIEMKDRIENIIELKLGFVREILSEKLNIRIDNAVEVISGMIVNELGKPLRKDSKEIEINLGDIYLLRDDHILLDPEVTVLRVHDILADNDNIIVLRNLYNGSKSILSREALLRNYLKS